MRLILRAFIFLCCVPCALASPGAGDVSRGNDLYRKGKFPEASESYIKALERDPSEARIEYNLGAAAYKAGDYDAAVEHFQKSLLTDDEKFIRDVHYNLGDAYYRSGIGKEDGQVQSAIKQLEKALGSFDKAVALDLKDKEAAENYEFVKKEIQRLKQKQQQQKQKQQEQQKQDQQKQDQQQQEQQKDQQEQKQDPSQDQQQKERSDQDKEDQSGPQDEKKDQGQSDQNKSDQDQQQHEQDNGQDRPEPEQKEASAGQNDDGKISSQDDANAMVDDLERNDLPKGLLNFIRQTREMKPVEKDW